MLKQHCDICEKEVNEKDWAKLIIKYFYGSLVGEEKRHKTFNFCSECFKTLPAWLRDYKT